MRDLALRNLPLLAALILLAALALPAFAGAPNPSGPAVPVVAVDADRTQPAGVGGTTMSVNVASEGAATPNATVDLTFHHLDGAAGTTYGLYRPSASNPTVADDAPLLNGTAYASGSGSNVTFPALTLDRVGRWVLLRADGAETASFMVALPPLVRVQDAKATPGVPTTLSVTVHDATDLGTLTLRIAYDATILQVDGVTPGDNVQGVDSHHTTGVVNVTYVSGDVPARSGTFALVHLQVRAIGAIGSVTTLNLTLAEGAHSNGTPIEPRTAEGTFVVGINGDANNDGTVDGQDVQRIVDHVLGRLPAWQPTLATTDLDRDGRVTSIDAMFIRQYLQGNRAAL